MAYRSYGADSASSLLELVVEREHLDAVRRDLSSRCSLHLEDLVFTGANGGDAAAMGLELNRALELTGWLSCLLVDDGPALLRGDAEALARYVSELTHYAQEGIGEVLDRRVLGGPEERDRRVDEALADRAAADSLAGQLRGLAAADGGVERL